MISKQFSIQKYIYQPLKLIIVLITWLNLAACSHQDTHDVMNSDSEDHSDRERFQLTILPGDDLTREIYTIQLPAIENGAGQIDINSFSLRLNIPIDGVHGAIILDPNLMPIFQNEPATIALQIMDNSNNG